MMNFRDVGLSDKTIQAIEEAGIKEPTTVQADVIPAVLAGKDVFTIAPIKCGKTCAYVFPLIEIMAQKKARNILIITSGSQASVAVSDRFAVFNKYHEISAEDVAESEESFEQEANVIIASPNLLSDLLDEDKIDLSQIDILVVDDINLIKKTHQLEKLEKILAVLPADKQNIVFTNRRSKETQSILDKILQTPEEIKINKNEEEVVREDNVGNGNVSNAEKNADLAEKAVLSDEKAQSSVQQEHLQSSMVKEEKGKANKQAKSLQNDAKRTLSRRESSKDAEALNLVKKYHTFGRNTPAFLLTAVELAEGD